MTLREAREKAGITQEELAERVGLSRTDISALERGGCVNAEMMALLRIEEAVGAWGEITWDRTPPGMVRMVVNATRTLSERYPLESVMVFLARLLGSKKVSAEKKVALLLQYAADELANEFIGEFPGLRDS